MRTQMKRALVFRVLVFRVLVRGHPRSSHFLSGNFDSFIRWQTGQQKLLNTNANY